MARRMMKIGGSEAVKYNVTLEFQTAENPDDDLKIELTVEANSEEEAVSIAKCKAVEQNPELLGVPLCAWHPEPIPWD